ncbi:polypeptide HsdS [Kocuria varians]|uniref:Polypeptide HsdS n=1 Tax=Kocuria varians TaxID=1272 RepID=A0A4Y4D1P3_KOCVA|nr:restriction endonuclease subunit S [Kocuria varians]GEC97849.1 polypeptide HsdS [Kocuria varians]
MSEWPTTTLGELIHVKHGYAFKGEHFAATGDKLVLKPGNFPIGGGLKLRPGKDDYYTGTYPPEFELAPGDMVVVMTDLTQSAPILGSPAFVPAKPSMLHNQRLGLVQIKPGAKVDERFLYYSMLSDTARSQVRATATGATVRHTAPERLYRVRIAFPDLRVQQSVGEILASVDELIENNRRRVEVLEEMARAIYREWFVKFRFPGHEDVPMVDSVVGPIPEGWRAATIGDALELKYGKALKASARRGGGVAVVSSAGVVGWHDESFVDGPAIVVGRKGNVGSVHWVDGPCWPIDTAYFVQTDLPLRFVSEQLRRTAFTNSHAAVPGLSREAAYAQPFLLPDVQVLDSFQALVDPLGSHATGLMSQNEKLAEVRDLLLPKLVTGQIDVSSLDLDAVISTGSTEESAVAQ